MYKYYSLDDPTGYQKKGDYYLHNKNGKRLKQGQTTEDSIKSVLHDFEIFADFLKKNGGFKQK